MQKSSDLKSENVEIVYVKTDNIFPNEWNPMKHHDKVFNRLVENIKDVGMDVPLEVRDVGNGKYELINGESRWMAAKILSMEKVPCVVKEYDKDTAMIQTYRKNFIVKPIDKEKFTKWYFDYLIKKYGPDTHKMVGLKDRDALDELIVKAREELPQELRGKFDEYKEEIRTVEDLSLILNRLFTEYGATLKYSFMFFMYGGRIHTMIKMNTKLKRKIDEIKDYCVNTMTDVNDVLTDLISGGMHDRSKKAVGD